jgi:hypothetical protein
MRKIIKVMTTILIPNLIIWFISLFIYVFKKGYYYRKKKTGYISCEDDFVNKFICNLDILWEIRNNKTRKDECDIDECDIDEFFFIEIEECDIDVIIKHFKHSFNITFIQVSLILIVLFVIQLFEIYHMFFINCFGIVGGLLLTYLLGRIVGRKI